MSNLDDLRKEIDALDHELLHVLAKRVEAVKKVGALKDMHNIPVVDEKRRSELLENVKQKAKGLGISEHFIEELFTKIHDHAVELQKK